MGEASQTGEAQGMAALEQAWVEEWGTWPSPICSRAFRSSPMAQELADTLEGSQCVGSPEVALRVVADVLVDVEKLLGQEVAELQARAAEMAEEITTLWQLADEQERDLLERLRGSKQAPPSLAARPETAGLSDEALRVGVLRLLDRPRALDWLRALRTLRQEAARVRRREAPPEAIAEPVGAALARGCSAGRASVALDVPVATVQRARPRSSLEGKILLEVESRHRDTLLRGLLLHARLGEADFRPEERVLSLKTAAGPDLGVPTYRSGFSKGHK